MLIANPVMMSPVETGVVGVVDEAGSGNHAVELGVDLGRDGRVGAVRTHYEATAELLFRSVSRQASYAGGTPALEEYVGRGEALDDLRAGFASGIDQDLVEDGPTWAVDLGEPLDRISETLGVDVSNGKTHMSYRRHSRRLKTAEKPPRIEPRKACLVYEVRRNGIARECGSVHDEDPIAVSCE